MADSNQYVEEWDEQGESDLFVEDGRGLNKYIDDNIEFEGKMVAIDNYALGQTENEEDSNSEDKQEPTTVRVMHRARSGVSLNTIFQRYPKDVIDRFVGAQDRVRKLQMHATGTLFGQHDPYILIVVGSTEVAVRNVFGWIRNSYQAPRPLQYRYSGQLAFVTAYDDLVVAQQLRITSLTRQIREFMRSKKELDSLQSRLTNEEVAGLHDRGVYFDCRPLDSTLPVPATEIEYLLSIPSLPADTFDNLGQYVIEMIWKDLSEAYERQEQATGVTVWTSDPTISVLLERHLLRDSEQYVGLLQQFPRLAVLVYTGLSESKSIRLQGQE